jgi:hypothetical protein
MCEYLIRNQENHSTARGLISWSEIEYFLKIEANWTAEGRRGTTGEDLRLCRAGRTNTILVGSFRV